MSTEAKFWALVEKTDGCWLWTGGQYSDGYGEFTISHDNQVRAHRYSYELANGPVPKELVLDHLCRTKLCVRPDHLEAVTQRVNVLRGEGIMARFAQRTTCGKGHPYPDNPKRDRRGGRVCRVCTRQWNREQYARRALA